MAKEIRLDPTNREIIRVLKDLKLAVTPSKIAQTITVHPTTVQNRLKDLDKAGITQCNKKGNRTYCKINPKWRKK
jgi:predicted transcriptional regulator